MKYVKMIFKLLCFLFIQFICLMISAIGASFVFFGGNILGKIVGFLVFMLFAVISTIVYMFSYGEEKEEL